MKWIVTILSVAVILGGCQEPTQPTDLTSTRTMSVELKRAEGSPISNATVVWERYTGKLAPVSGVGRTGDDGFAHVKLSDVATTRDSVRVGITLPNEAPFQGIDPLTFLMWMCTDTLISLSVHPPLQCGVLTTTDTITVKACPTSGNGTGQECRYYPTDCPPGLIFTTTDPGNGEFGVTPRSYGSSTSSVEVCATFMPGGSSTEQREFRTVVEGREPTSGALQVRVNLVIIGIVDCSSCPCPPSKTAQYGIPTACVNQASDFEIPLSNIVQPFDVGSDCVIELAVTNVTNADQVQVLSGRELTVRGGQDIPNIDVRVTGRQTGDLQSVITYGMKVRNLANGQITDCGETMVVDLTTPIVTGNCRVEPLMSDTLRKCVFNDSSTVDTIYLVNDGDCEATFTVATSNGFFGTQPSGEIIVEPRSRKAVIIFMRVTKGQWDANPQAPYGNNGAKDFSATMRIRGCDTIDIPLNGVGFVNCSAFKYQCLREFRPANFPNTYAESIQLIADKTNIVYQNDNQTFKRYDIWFQSITDLGGGVYEFAVGSGDAANNYAAGRFIRIAQNFQILPGQSICDTYPAVATTECQNAKNDPTAGSNVLGGLRAGDVVLFVKNDSQCALLWVQEISPDRVGQNALLKVCLEICYPMFTLP